MHSGGGRGAIEYPNRAFPARVKQHWTAVTACALSSGSKEEVALYLMFLGGWLGWQGERDQCCQSPGSLLHVLLAFFAGRNNSVSGTN